MANKCPAQVQESGQTAWFQIDLGEERLVSGIQVTNSWSERGGPLRIEIYPNDSLVPVH